MFEQVVNQINEGIEKRKLKQEAEKPVTFSISDIPSFNDAFFRERISNIDSLSDRELFEYLKTGYSIILEDIFIRDDSKYLSLFTNPRFLSIFIQVINSVQISYIEQIYCNKLAYDYLTNSNNIDEYIKSLFFTLSKTVNKSVIPPLLGLGLSDDFASYLALCRFSSTKEFVNVRRINYLLISSLNPKLFDEQMIIFIYEKLFDRFTDLFKATMFDVYTDEELENIGPGAAEIYANISLAIIDILNSMTSEDIRKVLISYSGDYNMDVNTSNIRFSIRSLAICDYKRILDIVDYLEKVENIFVP